MQNVDYEGPRALVRWHGAVLAVVCASVLVALAGCGQSSDDQMWEEVADLRVEMQPRLEQIVQGVAPPALVEQTHRGGAGILQRILDEHPNGPEELRAVLEEMAENEQRLADGEVSGAEADEIRQRHVEYWSHLGERELPPDFR